MSRRTTLGALVLALLILAAPSAAAKGPTEVRVHNLQTGETTLLTFDQREMHALGELVGWPAGTREPRGVHTGALKPVATLEWQNDDQTPFWFDRIYSDDTGWLTWVQRRDDLSGSGSVTWARVGAGHAFHAVLSAVEKPTEVTTDPLRAPAAGPSREPEREAFAPFHSTAAFDGSSFGWGAGMATLLAAGLALAARWRPQRSVTASRNSRVSTAASS